jgi:ATP adenylyltransferase
VKHLFSPWRAEYIKTFKNEKKSKSCLFCRIAKEKNDAKNLVVWRGNTCYAVLNKFPYNSGHLMIVPYRHTPDFSGLTKDENAEIMATSARCMKIMKKANNPQGFNFGANIGRVAGAGIASHVHFHIVPRWSGDTNFMPVLADVKMVSEDLKNLADRLRKKLL